MSRGATRGGGRGTLIVGGSQAGLQLAVSLRRFGDTAPITLVGVINGANVTGGAEGVGRMTTRSVVLCISAIIVTDMIFAYITTR